MGGQETDELNVFDWIWKEKPTPDFLVMSKKELDYYNHVVKQINEGKFKMARVADPDDVEEGTEEGTEETTENDEPVDKVKRGRPKGSGGVKNTTAFHGIVLTKRGIPKRVIVTHVMGKNVRVVSASNPDMEPKRILINSVRHFDSDVFDQLQERGNKIDGAIDQNFGLFNQLKPLNAPKRVAASTDPLDDL